LTAPATAPSPPAAPPPGLVDAWRDARRALLLAGKCLKFGLFPFARLVPRHPYRAVPLAVRLRRMMEELGLTYLKLGQFLAMRYDLLPPAICKELALLFEAVPPLAPEQARVVVEAELGAPVAALFAQFDPQPLAAASVAQVHRARTRRGEAVAVKIQRPGLLPDLQADIRNLRRLARAADALRLLGRLSTRGMVAEFDRWTQRELDFRIEGRTAEELRAAAQPFEVVPRVYWELTTDKVLTLEFVEGLSVSRVSQILRQQGSEGLRALLPNVDLDLSMRRLCQASFAQFFVSGFFHGDPHPGNVLFRDDNTVAFVDFGIFGSLGEDQRRVVTGQIENIAVGNLAASFSAYCRQLVDTEDTDPEVFRQEYMERLRAWYAKALEPGSAIEERHLGRVTGEMIDVSRRNSLRFGMNYLLFWRALNAVNATVWMVDPRFDLLGELRRFFVSRSPGLGERLREMAADPLWQEAVVRLAGAAKDRALDARPPGAGRPWRACRWESPPAGRQANRQARGLALALVALSAAVLLLAGPPAAPLPVKVSALLVPLALLALWRRR
jgi:ubiquinone biosynthesis protein